MLYGNLLRRVRKCKGLTQQTVADAIHVSRVQYSRYETNLIPMTDDILQSIAEYYDTTVDDFKEHAAKFNSTEYPFSK